MRILKDAVLYEFGVDHEKQKAAAETIFQAALASSSLFWNELATLERKQEQNLVGHRGLENVLVNLVDGLDAMAEAVSSGRPFGPLQHPLPNVPMQQPDAREAAYAHTVISRYRDLHSLLISLSSDR